MSQGEKIILAGGLLVLFTAGVLTGIGLYGQGEKKTTAENGTFYIQGDLEQGSVGFQNPQGKGFGLSYRNNGLAKDWPDDLVFPEGSFIQASQAWGDGTAGALARVAGSLEQTADFFLAKGPEHGWNYLEAQDHERGRIIRARKEDYLLVVSLERISDRQTLIAVARERAGS